MKTAITELFSIAHPIIQGGMHYVDFAELASALSNAGGLGIITGLTQTMNCQRLSAISDRNLPNWESRNRCSNCKSQPFADFFATLGAQFSTGRTAWLATQC